MGEGRVVLIASGLRDIGGHNYSYTREVELELKTRGFTVEVLAHRLLSERLRSETGYRPVFSKGTYDFPSGDNPLHSLISLWAQARVYASELNAALGLASAPARIIFGHTVSDFELAGWSRLLRRQTLRSPLVLMMRETPGFAEMGPYRRWVHPYTGLRARALRSINLRAGRGFVLATDTEQLTADYSNIFRGRIETYPIPVPAVPRNVPARDSGGPVTWGYVGDCRAAKGFPRLAPMIREVLAVEKEKIRFVVQMYRGTYDPSAQPPGWREIEELANLFPSHVKLIGGVLDDAGYQRLLSSLDGVLIPNDHAAFRAGSSNVFCEAVANGKPVVVAEGTWMAGEVSRYETGACFSRTEPSGFARTVLRQSQRWEEVAHRALMLSTEWQAKHNRAKLVDMLLGGGTESA